MTPKFFSRMERISPTQESAIRYSFNMVSSSVYKIAAAAESKFPNVTQEPMAVSPAETNSQQSKNYETPVTDNQTTANTKLTLTMGNSQTRMHVANAAFAATSSLDVQESEHMRQIREDIVGIHAQDAIDRSNEGSINVA